MDTNVAQGHFVPVSQSKAVSSPRVSWLATTRFAHARTHQERRVLAKLKEHRTMVMDVEGEWVVHDRQPLRAHDDLHGRPSMATLRQSGSAVKHALHLAALLQNLRTP
jgi:hypothetical protein